jgi:hypothetical protein|nr:hypothetical protein [Candidatus Acidoferrales bacterium]
MTKRERSLVGLLVVLAAVSGLIYYFNTRETSSAASVVSVDGNYVPMTVENPSLQIDKLEALRHVEYTGSHRNIFSETPPPHIPTPEEVKRAAANAPPVMPPPPPPPPPVQVDVKFYGYIDDPRTGARRAFFTNGEDIFIAGIGDMLENRLRVTKIGNDTVELMEVSSSRRTTIPIEQDAHP